MASTRDDALLLHLLFWPRAGWPVRTHSALGNEVVVRYPDGVGHLIDALKVEATKYAAR